MTGYVAWTCNGCRDVHYMREPMYVGGLCRRCADTLGLDDPVDADDLRRVAVDDGDPHKWSGVSSSSPRVRVRVRPACRKGLGCRCGRLDCPGVGRIF